MSVHEGAFDENLRRIRGIKRVLWIILVLNIAVALAKLFWGLYSKSAAMTADGFHSMFDGTSNVVGIIGMTLAARPADADHPYGHGKYETYAAVAIAAMLLVAAYSIGSAAVGRLMSRSAAVSVTNASFFIMLGTLAINLFVTMYERRVGTRLNAPILIADASHTGSDILVSMGVIVSLVLVKYAHLEKADAVISLVIAAVILYTAWGVLKQASATLSDTARIDLDKLDLCVRTVPGVIDTHHLRTRGTEAEVYADLHILVNPTISVAEGHEIAHKVEETVCATFPAVRDVVVHVEPYDPALATHGYDVGLRDRAQ